MVDFRAVSRDHVLAAMDEYDEVGGGDLLDRHGMGASRPALVRHAGRSYDLEAIVGVAFMRATTQAVAPRTLLTGRYGAVQVLRDLGFDVAGWVEPEPPPVATRPRTSRAAATTTRAPRAPRAAKPPPEPPPAPKPLVTCPRCFLVLPATGVCDDCD